MRCYRGCVNRRKNVWERCAACLKEESVRQKMREYWLLRRWLDNEFARKVSKD
jgi:hypothetical protein